MKRFCILTVLIYSAGYQEPVSAADDQLVEEVVVTATRRATSIMDVPDTVSVFNQEMIAQANIQRTKDFLQLVPNVSMGENRAGEAWISIRGLTNFRFGDPSVAVIVDGIQVMDGDGFNRDLFDIEKIEVLKGPQGALYGRGAVGGAIVIDTVAPGDEAGGWVKAGYGNADTRVFQSAVSGPLVNDKLAGRVTVSNRNTDGTFKNVITGVPVHRYEDTSAYARLRYTPSERVAVDFNFGNTDVDGAGTAFVAQLIPAGEALDANDASRPFDSEQEGFQLQDIRTASLKVNAGLSFADLTYSLGWYDMYRAYSIDTIPYRYDFNLTHMTEREVESVTQELRLTSSSDNALQWIAGLFYTDIDTRTGTVTNDDTTGISVPSVKIWPADSPWPTLNFTNDEGGSQAYAVYGQLSYQFSDKLEGAFALRYDSEDREQTNSAYGWSPSAGARVSETYSEMQPKATLRYRVSDDGMIYFSGGRGFKSGGFNPTGTEQAMRQFNPLSTVKDQVDAQIVDSFELGYKATLAAGRLRLQMAAFHSIIENAQSFEFNLTTAGNVISTAKEATVTGFELDGVWALSDAFTLNAGIGLLDSELTEFPDIPGYEGNKLPNVPEQTINAGLEYAVDMSSEWSAVARLDARREGARYYNWENTDGTRRDAYSLIDATVTFEGSGFAIALWTKNLTDEEYFDDYVPVIPIAGAAYKAPRRTYGVNLTYRF